ncbi:hypothetical protein H4S02_001056 [Coemansia sp. RSA 2611]|nr:hypothetical protein H4S02_001056 [Coemansia sp. RSA 2611]
MSAIIDVDDVGTRADGYSAPAYPMETLAEPAPAAAEPATVFDPDRPALQGGCGIFSCIVAFIVSVFDAIVGGVMFIVSAIGSFLVGLAHSIGACLSCVVGTVTCGAC